MSPSGDLHDLHARALDELEGARSSLAEAQVRFQNAESRVRLLDELIALEEGGEPGQSSRTPSQAARADFIDEVVAILEARGSAMSIGDIRAALLERGVPLPGKGTPANLISRFQRSDGRVVRAGRGMYDLDRDGRGGLLEFPDGRQVSLQRVTRIGKGVQCELVLADSDAAEVHALVTTHAGATVIGPVGDGAPVVVNGEPIPHPVRLADGDRITLGTSTLVYRDATPARG